MGMNVGLAVGGRGGFASPEASFLCHVGSEAPPMGFMAEAQHDHG